MGTEKGDGQTFRHGFAELSAIHHRDTETLRMAKRGQLAGYAWSESETKTRIARTAPQKYFVFDIRSIEEEYPRGAVGNNAI
jgi:hypothetical protein